MFHPSVMTVAGVCFELCSKSVSDISVANNTTISAGGTLMFPHPYLLYLYIRHWVSRLKACGFAIIPTSSTLMVGQLEREMAFAGCQRRWKRWGGRLAVDDHTYGHFIDMPFVRSLEELPNKNWLTHVILELQADFLLLRLWNCTCRALLTPSARNGLLRTMAIRSQYWFQNPPPSAWHRGISPFCRVA